MFVAIAVLLAILFFSLDRATEPPPSQANTAANATSAVEPRLASNSRFDGERSAPADSPPSIARIPRLRFVVVAADGGTVIAGATVTATWELWPSEDATETATTGADGTCTLPIRPGVRGFVRAVAPGRVESSRRLGALTGPGEVRIELRPSRETIVVVLDAASQQPIAGARLHTVALRPTPTTRNANGNGFTSTSATMVTAAAPLAVTDEQGRATLALAEGFLAFVADANGYCTACSATTEVPLASPPLVIALERGREVEIEVRDATGRPLPGWELQVDTAVPGVAWRGFTDARGRWISPACADGTRVGIIVRRQGLDPTALVMESLFSAPKKEIVTPTDAIVVVEVPEQRCLVQGTWTASVDDTLHVELLRTFGESTSPADRRTVGARDGSVRLAALGNDGNYEFQAIGTTTGIWRSEPFAAQCGTTSVVLSERVPRTGAVRVQVTARGGEPVQAQLWLWTSDAALDVRGRRDPDVPRRLDAAECDAAGRHTFAALLPGDYFVEARHANGTAVTPVTVRGEHDVSIALAAPGRIVGSVRPAAPNLTVEATAVTTHLVSATCVAADGTFELVVAAGDYEIAVDEPERMPWVTTSMGQRPVRAVHVEPGAVTTCVLDAPAVSRVVTVEVDGAGGVEAVIERMHPYDRQGSMVWRLAVPMTRRGVAVAGRIEVDAAYGVSVRGADGRLLGWDSLDRGSADRLRVTLGSTSTVTVANVDPSNDLRLVPLHATGVMLRDSALPAERAANGAATFARVPAGKYRLCRFDRGRISGSGKAVEVLVPGGGDVRVDWAAAR